MRQHLHFRAQMLRQYAGSLVLLRQALAPHHRITYDKKFAHAFATVYQGFMVKNVKAEICNGVSGLARFRKCLMLRQAAITAVMLE
jgi:hypothetical protein